MRKIKFFIAAVAFAVFAFLPYIAEAVPAYPNPIKKTQADGTTITIQLHGDEFFNYTTTSDGYNIVEGEDGIYYYAQLSGGELFPTKVRAKDPAKRVAEDRAVLHTITRGVPASVAATAKMNAVSLLPEPTAQQLRAAELRDEKTRSGEKFKSLIILVNFSNKAFTVPSPNKAFSDMLNVEGYTNRYGAMASARDYYYDNSNGRFDPDFVVVGPYTLPQTMTYYGGNVNNSDKNPQQMVIDACRLADADVNFAEFADDGIVRDIFIFYAGHNEAEGGGTGTIWPHRWELFSPLTLDGVSVVGYACSSEYAGSGGTRMAGIGTFCHEFGHVLGWPDFYDTNYATNGQSVALDRYSLMNSGSYNNGGHTPSAVTALERYMKGWLEPREFTESGIYTLPPVREDDAFIIKTESEGEFFIIENRNSEADVWDAALAAQYGVSSLEGLLVMHVDRSENIIPGLNVSAKYLWDANLLNAVSSHECCKIIRAGELSNKPSWLFSARTSASLSDYTHSDFKSWSGNSTGKTINKITQNGYDVTFYVGNMNYDIKIETLGQNDVDLSWDNSTHTGNFTVTWESEYGESGSLTTSNKYVYLSPLSMNTLYTIRISPPVVDDSEEQYTEMVIATLPQSNAYASMMRVKGIYYVDDNILLRLINIIKDVDSIEWTVNGAVVEPPQFKLTEVGAHTVVATINYADGTVERLIKKVNVRN